MAENETSELIANLTAMAIRQGHEPIVKRDRVVLFETKFEHVQHQLTFALWFFLITIAKIAFHRFDTFKRTLPDSALLFILGSIFGAILQFILPDEDIYLQPDWFFLYLLPPIVLEAGYFLPNKDFFQNIGTISTYAVAGTLWNIASTGAALYIFNGTYDKYQCNTCVAPNLSPCPSPNFIELLLFATLISAVDPVAVICVFEEIHVNHLLYICVFGESLLNDAVTIVLYHTFEAIAEVGAANVFFSDYLMAVVAFFSVSIGGLVVGAIWAVLTGIVTKWGTGVSVVQPLTCLLFPYLAYLVAEALGLSGILAIVVCGLMMKHYIIGNISEQSKVTVNFFMKTLSSSCEAMIFVFLGLSAVSKKHRFDPIFISVTLISILLFRFIGVAFLTYLLNLRRLQKIDIVDQFIMGYGGIRGAVCYGLVMSLSPELVLYRDMFATTTIIVIFFTVFIQGGTIKKVVYYLNVKKQVDGKKTVFEMICDNMNGHIVGGVESVVGHRGNYWLRMMISRFDEKYIQPYIMVKPENHAMRLIRHNEEIQVTEAVKYLRQHGSFAGMPTVQSKTNLHGEALLRQTNGSLLIPGQEIKTGRSLPIPRNQSLTTFVADKLASIKTSRQQRYSRHFMPGDFPMLLFNNETASNEDSYVNDDNYKTYPYSKTTQKDFVISALRKVSRTNSGPANGSTSGATSTESSPVNKPNPQASNGSKAPRPTFVISDHDGDDHEPHAETPNFSIGRFEVGPEQKCNEPSATYSRRQGRANGSPEESVAILMPIEEVDENSSDNPSTSTTAKKP